MKLSYAIFKEKKPEPEKEAFYELADIAWHTFIPIIFTVLGMQVHWILFFPIILVIMIRIRR